MSHNAIELRLEDLEIRPYLISRLKRGGIESILDLAISIPHELVDDGGVLTGADAQIAKKMVL